MSKYFAEYLPVEGEIKEGDYYIDEGERWKRQPQENSAYPPEHYIDKQKVKLFLCSRDIKVGDKIICDERNHISEPLQYFERTCKSIENGWVYTNEVEGQGENPNWTFKVIGEISPDALGYVKRGDKFDEYEEWWWNPDIGIPIMKRLKEEWDKKIDKEEKLAPIIKVKGPCGHFH